MKRKTTRVCKICTIEKENEQYEKGKQTCKECFHLLRCYVCKGVFEKKNCRAKNRCNKCDNKLHYDKKKENPTPAFLDKVKRAAEAKKRNRYKAPPIKNPQTKINKKLRSSIKNVFNTWSINKEYKSYDYLDYTSSQFLERFPEIPKGMDIDHKIPLSWFEVDSPINILFHLDNLQLLKESENRSKKNYWAHPVSQSYYDLVLPHIKPEYVNKLLIEK